MELQTIRNSRKAGPKRDHAEVSFYIELAEAYFKIFGVRASPADEGYFMKSIKAAAEVLPFKKFPSENKMRRILDSSVELVPIHFQPHSESLDK